MSSTRGTLMSNARDISQTTGSNQWSDAIVRVWLGVCHRRAWKQILNANNEYRMAMLSVTQDANGQFLKTALDSGSGDTAQTHYRILSLSDNQQFFYRQVRYQDFPSPASPIILPYVWYELGTSIQVNPVQQGAVCSAMVNWMPTRADNLASDASVVDFPDDYENALSFHTAAMIAMKGGNEIQAASVYKAQGDAIIEDMLNDLRRAGKDPTRMRAMDDAASYGG